MILGLTGGYCSGKNLAAGILAEQGWLCIDVDKLGHEALALCIADVTALLGPSAVDAEGRPDRKAIGAAVFAEPLLLARYEGIVHPAMFRLCDEKIEAALTQEKNVCVNAMILYKMPQADRCDLILELRAPLCRRVIRGMQRDRLPLRRILERIIRQRGILARGRLYGRKRSTIMNGGKPAALKGKVLDFLKSTG